MDVPPLEARQHDLVARLADVCGFRNVVDAQLVEVVADALDGDAWFMFGVTSPEHFVSWQTGSSSSRSRHVVAVARRLSEFPVCTAAFRRGELSLDQMNVIATRAPGWADAEVAALAVNATVRQLAYILREYTWPTVTQPEDAETDTPGENTTSASAEAEAEAETDINSGDEPSAAAAGGDVDASAGATDDEPVPPPVVDGPPPRQDFLSLTFDERGRFRLSAEGDATDGARIQQALNAARDRLFNDGHRDATWVDALVAVAENSLGTITSPKAADRYRTYLHHDPTTGRSWVNGGDAIPQGLFEFATCDGIIHLLSERGGRPIDVGRATRTVPNALRRIVLDRDRSCRHPGCDRTRGLQIHHIVHWAKGGPTNADNLIALCPTHHRSHHKGLCVVTGNGNRPDGLIWWVNGTRITHPKPKPPDGPPPGPPDGGGYRHPLGERYDRTLITFTPPNERAA